MFRFIKYVYLALVVLAVLFLGYLFIGKAKPAEHITWGVHFSADHARYLGLDWQEVYLSLLDDLGVRHVKLTAQWNRIEPEEGKYMFGDLDWQIREVADRGGKVVVVVGLKTPRWPECHIPDWVAEKGMGKEEIQESVLAVVREVITRYRNEDSIFAWQVENEPFFLFGECPSWYRDAAFVKREVALVRELDSAAAGGKARPIIMTDTGEQTLWWKIAPYGDMIGATLYRRLWSDVFHRYTPVPLPAVFYSRRAQLVKWLFDKEVIGVELQAEPWGPEPLGTLPRAEQEKTMSFAQFQKNIAYARATGLDTFYFWGVEWWHWLREQHNDDQIWEEAKTLFQESISGES